VAHRRLGRPATHLRDAQPDRHHARSGPRGGHERGALAGAVPDGNVQPAGRRAPPTACAATALPSCRRSSLRISTCAPRAGSSRASRATAPR
jgi:hypothetical protein